MRERSKRRAELFSLSQSVSAARSQRLLMSLYCCWISKLSKSVGERVLMVSALEEDAFNLEVQTRGTEKRRNSVCGQKGRGDAWRRELRETDPLKLCRVTVGL